MSIAVVWLKRDLRLSDHQPLKWAEESGLPVLLLYNFEPMLLADEHFSARHWAFIAQSLQDIQSRVPNSSLYCASSDMLELLQQLHKIYNIDAIFSYQEVGLRNTHERDIAIHSWCDSTGILWREAPYAAVIRGKKNRSGWDANWDKVMRADVVNSSIADINWLAIDSDLIDETRANLQRYAQPASNQIGGESQAWEVLSTFFADRGKDYAFRLSSPQSSQQHCSRLSPYLAWGNVSLRQVYQALLNHWNKPGWRRSLMAFSSRLHWHCHFIQKFESESEMEFRAVNRGYESMPRVQGEVAYSRLVAWQSGQTGIPMVDACMRCLNATGYLNFRMRAMLVSFLCHHLEVDWRMGVKHLARVFLDFEPGIHYSQFQMQAGVTGINTVRIYNPVKQGQEKDPDGAFIINWVPELRGLPSTLLHTPWLLTSMEQTMFGVELGKDYPHPIVRLEQSYKQAQSLLWSWRNKPKVVMESQRILKRHVRPE